jgi:molybdopterin-guanine dinucleotide biosynthesis protein MobB
VISPSHPIISFIGTSKSGKTTVIESLVRYLSQKNRFCMVLKHIHREGTEFDHEGKNTWRFSQAGAAIVGGLTADKAAFFINQSLSQLQMLTLLQNLINSFPRDQNSLSPVILLEGFREISAPQILCGKTYEDIAKQINPSVVVISGAFFESNAEIEKVKTEFSLPCIDFVHNPEFIEKFL